MRSRRVVWGFSRNWCALALAGVLWGWSGGEKMARAGDIPRFDRNVAFLSSSGAPVYLAVDMQSSNFLGVPAVIGVWTDGLNVLPFAAIPTNDPRRWVWLTSGGPAGVIEFHPGQNPFATWKDNVGNSGTIVTF